MTDWLIVLGSYSCWDTRLLNSTGIGWGLVFSGWYSCPSAWCRSAWFLCGQHTSPFCCLWRLLWGRLESFWVCLWMISGWQPLRDASMVSQHMKSSLSSLKVWVSLMRYSFVVFWLVSRTVGSSSFEVTTFSVIITYHSSWRIARFFTVSCLGFCS